MRDVVGRLSEEHRVIERVLTALERAATRDVPMEFYEQVVHFLGRYADGCHHAKEEEILFPLLEARGLPRRGPTEVMREEHEVGRAHLGRLAACAKAGDREGARRESLGYSMLLRDHIYKEDEILFPMADALLTPQDLEQLDRGFDAADRALAERADLEALARELEHQVAGTP